MSIAIVGRWIGLTITCLSFFLGCDKDTPVDGGVGIEPRPVPVYFDHPTWHPEGKWIAVEHSDSIDADRDGKIDQYFSGIWLINSNTGEKQPLIRGYALPAWSPDGKFLAMVQASQIFTVHVMNLEPAQIDSNSITQLTFEGGNFYPAWSHDGQWIAFDNSDCSGDIDTTTTPNSCGVLIMERTGQNVRFISIYSRMPSWHPLDLKLLFRNRTVLEGGEVIGDTIWAYNVKGDHRNLISNLTDPNYDNQFPKYAPDGTEIAFYSKPRVGPPAIWKMSYDGSSKQKVIDYAWRFDWSPDGKKFIFLYLNYDDRTHPGNGQLWLINTDGSGLTQLTFFSR